MEAEQAVKQSIKKLFPVFTGNITEATTAAEVPGWDSIAHVQLMLLIEEKVGRELSISYTFKLKTVGELIGYVRG